MNKLLVNDLSATRELDGKAMAEVQGGTYGYAMPKGCLPSLPNFDYGKGPGDIDFNASQVLGQSQDTTVNNGNNVAFASGITSSVNPTQNGSNNISFR
ncbi:MAG TPA: hypothetical protein VIM12_17720 [Noviherbaspirillum sp.]|jgi:hypothetical protein|uniref:hypothetical protein n=1 Tax=Noviherbaspirillum sp. TaxID=1926288 RepID=UPI002F92F0EB